MSYLCHIVKAPLSRAPRVGQAFSVDVFEVAVGTGLSASKQSDGVCLFSPPGWPCLGPAKCPPDGLVNGAARGD